MKVLGRKHAGVNAVFDREKIYQFALFRQGVLPPIAWSARLASQVDSQPPLGCGHRALWKRGALA
jgi:hypothetical protein